MRSSDSRVEGPMTQVSLMPPAPPAIQDLHVQPEDRPRILSHASRHLQRFLRQPVRPDPLLSSVRGYYGLMGTSNHEEMAEGDDLTESPGDLVRWKRVGQRVDEGGDA